MSRLPVAAVLGLAALALPVAGGAAGAPAAQRDFDLEALLEVRHPSVPEWSPDGDRIAFLWRDGTAVGLWLVEPGGEAEPEVVDAGDADRPVEGFTWAPDGSALAWSDGDLHLWTPDPAGSGPGRQRRLTATDASETLPRFTPDGTRLVFARGAEVRSLRLSDADVSAVQDADVPAVQGEVLLSDLGARVLELRVAPDGTRVAALARRSETREVDATALVGESLTFHRRHEGSPDLALVPLGRSDAAGDGPAWLEQGPARSESVSWSDDGRLAWQEVTADARTRRILVAEGAGWEPSVRFEETDPAWWSLTWLDAGPRWEPGGERLAFLSDWDGWCHVYVLDVPQGAGPRESPEPIQVTSGRWEAEEPVWHPEGGSLVVATNRGSATERFLWLVDVPGTPTVGGQGGAAERAPGAPGTPKDEEPGPPEAGQRTAGPEPLTRLRGTSILPRWSPDGTTILFLHADPRRPLDLWAQPPRDAEATQLTDSWPEEVSAETLVEPVAVRFVGADGELVPGLLLAPREPGAEPGPGLVWVHGGGIRQNRWGWPPLRGSAVFHGLNQLLVQRGYTVLAVDYRGSIGYGREFRVAHHRDVGGVDLDDVLAAGRYLRRLDRPRVDRVGVGGFSYGGYLALQALVSAPPAFEAAVDVAGVADWTDWARDPGGPWIVGRMGDPDDDDGLYRERSPLHGVGRIVRPLLVLHGTDDRTVPVLQSLRLIDALVAAGRPFDSTIYPGEAHVFTRDATWRDASHRVEVFLDRHLRR